MSEVTDAVIDRMVAAIVAEADPEMVILFGSRGRGDFRVRIPTIPITGSGGFRSPWRRAEVHRGAGVGLRV